MGENMQELSDFIEDMNNEAGLLLSFSLLEEEMQRAVSEKRWDSLESIILRLRKKSDLVNRAEEQRVKSFEICKASLGAPENTGFFRLLPLIPDEKRRIVTESYRKLKIAVYSVKNATLRLSYYFQSVSETLKTVLSELFPHRKGKIYARNGKATETIDTTLILNKSL